MPELPEVEIMAAGLRKALLGRVVERVKVIEKGVLQNTSSRVVRGLVDCRVLGLSRRGKFLFIHLSDGTKLLFHMKMTGRLVIVERGLSRGRWDRLQLEFAGWDRKVTFEDQRKFGCMAVVTEEGDFPVSLACELGPDALTVSRSSLRDTLEDSRRSVKALLLDQRAIAGLGNIYVDESLHRARIHPRCPASEVDTQRANDLHRSIRHILKKAIKCGGSTVRTFSDSRGIPGTFQKHHRVYGRKGKNCLRCRSEIIYERVASRGTHFCPVCQKMPEEFPC